MRAVAAGNRERAAIALNNIGEVAKERGDYTAAQAYCQKALALAREISSQPDVASFLVNLVDVDVRLGQLAEAHVALQDGLALAYHLGALPWVLAGIMYAANLAYAEGRAERALALYGLARHHPAWDSESQREMDAELARWGLEPAMVEAGLAKGAELDFDQTLQELLNEDRTSK